MLTNYQQLIISLAPYAPALALCDPSLLVGYTSQPRVQLIKTPEGNNIRVMLAPEHQDQMFKNYGVDAIGPALRSMLNISDSVLVDLDSIASGQVDLLVTGTCEQLHAQLPMDTNIACYQPHHDHLQMLVTVDIASDQVTGYYYYSRNFNEDFCVINVYHFDAEGGITGISTETWYNGASSYHHFNLRGVNVYKTVMTGSHRNDLSRIYLNITPPADAEPTAE